MDCDLCDRPATLSTGRDVYPDRPDLFKKLFWTCHPCNARVGCHPGTENPLGGMATQAMRMWRIHAHRALDDIWKGTDLPRSEAYAWLAGALGIDQKDCHIGQMGVQQCRNVINAVARRAYDHSI